MQVRIDKLSPSSENARALFKQLDAHNMSCVSPDICHLTQPEELESIDSVLLGIFSSEKLAGMAGLKLFPDYAEVTRMFVKPEYRGKGLATLLLDELQSIARQKRYRFIRLETSDKFKSACKLYFGYGFTVCDPFGEYVNKAVNMYLEKEIT